MEVGTISDVAGLSLAPVATKRASEAIYEQIKEKILAGDLRPGDRLPSERQMMEMLQRSRPTIREALRMLERDGFIKISAGTHGAIVLKFGAVNIVQPLETILQVSDITVRELYEFRVQCECAIVEWAAVRREEDDMTQLEDALKNAHDLLMADDCAAFFRTDTVFHRCLAEASHNEVACIINGVLHNITERIMDTVLSKRSSDELRRQCRTICDEHEAIFRAIRKGAPDQAREAMLKHLEAFSEEMKEGYTR